MPSLTASLARVLAIRSAAQGPLAQVRDVVFNRELSEFVTLSFPLGHDRDPAAELDSVAARKAAATYLMTASATGRALTVPVAAAATVATGTYGLAAASALVLAVAFGLVGAGLGAVAGAAHWAMRRPGAGPRGGAVSGFVMASTGVGMGFKVALGVLQFSSRSGGNYARSRAQTRVPVRIRRLPGALSADQQLPAVAICLPWPSQHDQ